MGLPVSAMVPFPQVPTQELVKQVPRIMRKSVHAQHTSGDLHVETGDEDAAERIAMRFANDWLKEILDVSKTGGKRCSKMNSRHT